MIMKKITKSNIKMIVENVVKTLLNENIDMGFIEQYKKRFNMVQQKYNNFFNSNNYSYALFYNIMLEFDELKNEFELKKRMVLNQIYKQTDGDYYKNLENNNYNENSITEMERDVEQMSNTIEQASNALMQLDEVPYTINIF